MRCAAGISNRHTALCLALFLFLYPQGYVGQSLLNITACSLSRRSHKSRHISLPSAAWSFPSAFLQSSYKENAAISIPEIQARQAGCTHTAAGICHSFPFPAQSSGFPVCSASGYCWPARKVLWRHFTRLSHTLSPARLQSALTQAVPHSFSLRQWVSSFHGTRWRQNPSSASQCSPVFIPL